MRKYILGFISVIIIGSIAGCGGNVESKDKATTKVEETSNETTYLMEEETSLELDGNTSEATIEIVEETTTIVAEQEITTKEDQNETQKKTSKPVETTQKKTAKPANKPAATTTQKATEKQTSKPTVMEAPIVTKIGNVDNATYNKAVSTFEGIVKKMRKDGVVKATDICIVMEGSTIKVDINYADKDTDLILTKGSNNIYTLTVDYEFCWLSGIATTING